MSQSNASVCDALNRVLQDRASAVNAWLHKHGPDSAAIFNDPLFAPREIEARMPKAASVDVVGIRPEKVSS
jgi:hypothetical protein